jgi:glucoamylase
MPTPIAEAAAQLGPLHLVGHGEAFGWPGLDSHWAPGAKQGVGAAWSDRSRVWFTIAQGVLTEVFYPYVDVPNTRDLQFLITDGETFFQEERRDLQHTITYADQQAPAYVVASVDPRGEYLISKIIVADPDADAVLLRTRFDPLTERAKSYRLFLLFAPRVKNQGFGNRARVLGRGSHRFLTASREDVAVAVATSVGFRRASAGFVGRSDGWQDLHDNLQMDWIFAEATGGHVALTGEIDLRRQREVTVALAFGRTDEDACATAHQSSRKPFDDLLAKYAGEWREWCGGLLSLRGQARDAGRIFCTSAMILRIHQDKTHAGAAVASLATPWGNEASDANTGGYHLVWPRDLYKTAMAFLALDDVPSARRILHYLARTQAADGHWPQNFWLDGTPYWRGIQLDETSYPIILAWRLHQLGAVVPGETIEMVRRAAAYLLRHGPVTDQERWEENSGFSPATIAAIVTALLCAAELLDAVGADRDAEYLRAIADAWNAHIERWTYTYCSALLSDHPEHYERIATIASSALDPLGAECRVFLPIHNLPPSAQPSISQCCVIDGGFLDLVRFGLRAPTDPHVIKTLAVYDAVLRADTRLGPVWHRYNYDGYGEKADGSPYDGTGIGRGWSLLTGEHGHYELAAGRSADLHIETMERFANDGGMIPEQVWDADDVPERGLRNGKGTGSAAPLVWAHAEYLMLLRSKRDGRVFERVEPVYDRYVRRQERSALQIWRFKFPVTAIAAHERLRLQLDAPAIVHWSADGWMTRHDNRTEATGLGVHVFEFPPAADGSDLVFTFYWPEADRWEGRDFVVKIHREVEPRGSQIR